MGKTEIENLIKDLNSSDEEIVRMAAFKLGELKADNAKPYLIALLGSSNWSIRDAAAIGLGEMGANEVVDQIVDLIKLPENSKNNGSLIYALENLDTKGHFLYFINLLVDKESSLETREMALDIIEKDVDSIDQDTRQIAEKLLIEGKKNKYVFSDEKFNPLRYIDYALELLQ